MIHFSNIEAFISLKSNSLRNACSSFIRFKPLLVVVFHLAHLCLLTEINRPNRRMTKRPETFCKFSEILCCFTEEPTPWQEAPLKIHIYFNIFHFSISLWAPPFGLLHLNDAPFLIEQNLAAYPVRPFGICTKITTFINEINLENYFF
jgi:hypothetical protein